MFSSFLPFATIKFGFGRSVPSSSSFKIDLPSVAVHDTEHSDTSKRSRRLKHLLKLNHVNHAILFNNLRFHNHTPHILGSAYILGGDADHLNAIYDAEAASGLVPWEDSPGEIARHDWRDFLGKREYERAFVDFFEDQLVLRRYEWRAVVGEFLLEGKEPLANNLISGLGHPLIHLGYAYELNSREVAMEALGLAATNYNHLHKYLDDPKYSQQLLPTEYSTSSPLEILARVNEDKRLDGLFSEPGGSNLDDLFDRHESIVLEHWNAWKITDPKAQFEQSQQAAVALLISAAAAAEHSPQPAPPPFAEKAKGAQYDFYLLHLLTTSHAVRILLPFLPASHHLPLLRQWFLLTVALYIAQLRPTIDVRSHILDYDVAGRDWEWVVGQQALRGRHALDAHYVKGIRAIKEAKETWGDPRGEREGDEGKEGMRDFYLKAAVRFAREFDGWGGFSAAEMMEEEEKEKEKEGVRREKGVGAG
jgi:Questin oxidase-like